MGYATATRIPGGGYNDPANCQEPFILEIANGETANLYKRDEEGNFPLIFMLAEVVSITAGSVKFYQSMDPNPDGSASADLFNTQMNAELQQREWSNIAPLGRVQAYADGGDVVLTVTKWLGQMPGRY